MSSAKLCALLVLVLVVVASASPYHNGPIPEGIRVAFKKCANLHGVDDVKRALHTPTLENGCFYNCVKNEVESTYKISDFPMAKDYADCQANVPRSGNDCADAFELKKCMHQKFMESHPGFKQE